MRRFVGIFLLGTILAFAFAFSSLLPQRAMAASASLSTQKYVMLTSVADQPLSGKHGGYGYREGYHDGYSDGYEVGLRSCYEDYHHRDGWTHEGDWEYRQGYHDGFRRGYDAGKDDCYGHGDDRANHDSHHGHHGHHGDRDRNDHHDDHNNHGHNDDHHKGT
jgi:hypothetical protein